MPRSSRRLGAALVAVLLSAACAQQPAPREAPEPPPPALPPLPATLIQEPECPGCLAVTLTLRPDGAYLLRDELGASEFYDFGRWRYAQGTLELSGERDNRRYALTNLKPYPRVEQLRGPFRMVGVYDGTTFKECRTGLTWRLADTRASQNLIGEYRKKRKETIVVALDAQFEGSPEVLRVLRPAAVLDARGCPG